MASSNASGAGNAAPSKAPPLPPVSASRGGRPDPRTAFPKAGVPVFSESASSAPCGPPLPFPCRPRCCAASWKASSEAVNAPVTIESFPVNPFTLGIAVRGVRVPHLEEDGNADGALLTIERLDIGHASGFSRTPPPFRPPSAYNPVLDITYLGNGLFSSQNCCPRRARPTPPRCPAFRPERLIWKADHPAPRRPCRHGPHGQRRELSCPAPALGGPPFAPTLSALVNGTRIDVEGTEPDAETLRTTFAIHTAPLHMEHFKRYLSDFTP